jgi:PAS domain S-box-containing protein
MPGSLAETAKTRISTSLWVSFGVVLLILVATLLVYAWQSRQTSDRAETLTGLQTLAQATWEMRQSNSDIARYVADYTRQPGQGHPQQLSDAETAFDRAALMFSQFGHNDEARGQSQEIDRAYQGLRKSADDIVSLASQKQAALAAVHGTAGETTDLMQGMLDATVADGSQASGEKLVTVLDMSRSLNEITAGIDAYPRGPDPAIRQQVMSAGEEFHRASDSFQGLALSSLESTWVRHTQDQVEKLLADGAALFAVSDNLSNAMARFQAASAGMETLLAGQVQPLVDTEMLAASQGLTGSANSTGTWVLALGILAVIIGIAAVLVISRRVTGRLSPLLSGAAVVASGRIEHRFNADAKDEFGQLALSLNKMLDNLKRSRDALGESEELAWGLLDATHDAAVLTDLRGTILASNEIAARRFDRSLEQMIDESLYDLLPAESAASLKAHVAEITRTGKPVHYEDEGEGKIVEHDLYPVSEHKGEISKIAFFSRDVTMRKWVEDVTEQLARRNALILESAGEGIFGLDSEGRTTFVNPAAARMHGYKPEELVGKKHHDLVHHSRADGKLYPPERCPVHATLRDGTVHSNVDDEVFWRKDGTAFQVEYTSTPIIEDGRIAGAVITFRDIGDRKRVEKALRESEEKYRSVVESAASLIIWLDREGSVTDCSPRVERFLGYTPAEVVGRPFLDLVHQQDRPGVEAALSATAREGSGHDHHFRMALKRGGYLEVSMNTALAGDARSGHGRTICMVSAAGQRVRG